MRVSQELWDGVELSLSDADEVTEADQDPDAEAEDDSDSETLAVVEGLLVTDHDRVSGADTVGVQVRTRVAVDV